MPRYVLGPRVGNVVIPSNDTPAPDPTPEGLEDQGLAFEGVTPDRAAIYRLDPVGPKTRPLAAVHLVFVTPPIPADQDAAWFLSAAFARTSVPVLDPTASPLTVHFPDLSPGTWDGQTVLEYAE